MGQVLPVPWVCTQSRGSLAVAGARHRGLGRVRQVLHNHRFAFLKNAPKNCLIWSGRPRAKSGHARDQLAAVNRFLRLFTVGDAHGGSAAPINCLIWSVWHSQDPGRFATWRAPETPRGTPRGPRTTRHVAKRPGSRKCLADQIRQFLGAADPPCASPTVNNRKTLFTAASWSRAWPDLPRGRPDQIRQFFGAFSENRKAAVFSRAHAIRDDTFAHMHATVLRVGPRVGASARPARLRFPR